MSTPQVWPGAVHYPDFAHPAAQEWWTTHLKARPEGHLCIADLLSSRTKHLDGKPVISCSWLQSFPVMLSSQEFHKQMPFDGIWEDMNELSNFCTGDVCEVRKMHTRQNSARR